jgi:signal transduction histidine kinase/ligand-binding sensor domain-containing protein
LAPCAFALDPFLDITQYAHTVWRVRDGFTKGAIGPMAQTPDGYLWLGTGFGLYRFDGARAVAWQPPIEEPLPDNSIRDLLVTRDGTLWIATLKGLASWKDRKLTVHTEVAGSAVDSLVEDHQGTVWFALQDPGRVCEVQAGRTQCYGAGSFGGWTIGLHEDHKGNLWLCADNGLWRWAPGPPEHYSDLHCTGSTRSIIEDTGALLLVTTDGLKQLSDGKVQNYVLPFAARQFEPDLLFRSSDGSLWIGTSEGLVHLHNGRADAFGVADGLSGTVPEHFFEDREGNIWVSTLNGLDRFRDYASSKVSMNQGLSSNYVLSVQATSDGTIWISALNGLNRWQDGRITVYGAPAALSHNRTRNDRESSISSPPVTQVKGGLVGPPRTLGQDDLGRLWASTTNGAYYFDGAQFIAVPEILGGQIFAISGDGHGKIWVNHGEQGLLFLNPGDAVQRFPWSQLGHVGFPARTLLPDRLNGGVWLGFQEGGIFYFKDGQVRASYNPTQGLGKGRVSDLRLGPQGTLWAATENGLSRIKDGHVTTLTARNGLPCDHVHWSTEDSDHSVWLFMPCGLVRIARSEVDAWVSDPKRAVRLTLFDASDGVTPVADWGGYGPHVTTSGDGKIWFITNDGVNVIDPQHLPYNKVPPPVHIEQVTADGKVYDAANGVRLPRLVRNVDIDYTALSLAVPEKVRFRVKLEGEDKDWRELVNVRNVEYTNLPPKHYRFLVKACNNSGVWNEEGAALDFVIPPAWYQTNWFRAACVAAFLALLWAMYQLRLRQMALQFNMRLEERVSERTRIARDLHDTLLQSFQGLLLRFQAARYQLPHRPEEACEALDSALVSADQALAEGRRSIQELRAEPLKESDMEQMLLAMGRGLASSQNGEHGCPPLRVIVEGTRRAKRPVIRQEVYRIARELLRNAYRHAHARNIEAELRYAEDAFVLIVRDDGKGIDPEVLKERGRAGHWGLPGIYERAAGIGARLDVWSEAGVGTEVRLTVPSAIVYEKSGHGGRFKLFRKTRSYEHRS